MIDTLFIDIDGTITRFRDAHAEHAGPELLGHRLLALMRDRAARRLDTAADRAEAVIREVFHNKTWWDWEDFLHALDLDSEAFWRSADESETRYIQPREADLAKALSDLKASGYELIITSNNPTSGIRHKMRLAGLDDRWQRRHVSRLLGTDRVRAMKWDAEFWHQALRLARKEPTQVVVIGDTWHDDVLMPREAGIFNQLIFEHHPPHDTQALPGVLRINGWPQVAEELTKGLPRIRIESASLRPGPIRSHVVPARGV